jgi:alanyl-tRNA synthetase
MGGEYHELHEQRDSIHKWLHDEEVGFGRTLATGLKQLEEIIERAVATGAEGIAATDAFRLHDEQGFPIDLTLELAAERGLGVDEDGFERLMGEQRNRARFGSGRGQIDASVRERAVALAGSAGFETEFVGYETTDQETTVGAIERDNGRVLVKLLESPFYATGGGQVADTGWIECADGDCLARVDDVLRFGNDQVVAVSSERGDPKQGERVHAHVDRYTRHATEANHTATHLLHAALRSRLGTHVRQAGSYVGPDKLRFDFTHGQALSAEELTDVEDMVNRWIVEDQPVRALTTTLDEARRLGAMALFGEKYGDVVRMVEVGDGSFSRELCGGTHVRFTSQIGVLKVLGETSSAANVRRIEAVTGPEAVNLMRRHDRALTEAGRVLRVPPERVPDGVAELRQRAKDLEKAARRGGTNGAVDLEALAGQAQHRDGARWLAAVVEVKEGKALMDVADKLRARLGDAAVVLGRADGEHVDLVANVAPALVQRGVRANEILTEPAKLVGGGGGGRDTVARAGGRDPAKLPDAIAAAQAAIEAALDG